MNSALIYGHSQAEPTGMGDDMLKALKAKGVKVTRVGRHGYNDAKLLSNTDELGDVSGYDHVFLYAGGNSDKPTPKDLRKLVQYFGGDRSTVVLSPVNLGGEGARAPEVRRPVNAGNRAGVEDIVKVYEVEAPASSFKRDGIHLKSGSPESKALVESILTDLSESKPSASSAPPDGSSSPQAGSPALLWVLALVALVVVLRRR